MNTQVPTTSGRYRRIMTHKIKVRKVLMIEFGLIMDLSSAQRFAFFSTRRNEYCDAVDLLIEDYKVLARHAAEEGKLDMIKEMFNADFDEGPCSSNRARK